MTLKNPVPGPNSAAEYLVAGVPFFTSSAVPAAGWFGVAFPFVTRTILIRNTGASPIQVGVTVNGTGPSGSNYYLMPAGAVDELDFRTTTLFVYAPGGASSVSVAAGLTTIPASLFPLLTGSISGSNIPGVG